MSLRPCWKYEPVPCSLGDIKKGDLFRLGKRDEADTGVNPDDLLLATTDARKEERGQSMHVVEAARFIEDPTYGEEKEQ